MSLQLVAMSSAMLQLVTSLVNKLKKQDVREQEEVMITYNKLALYPCVNFMLHSKI